MTAPSLFQQCQELADQAEPFVVATLVEAVGSTPQDQGARMIVTAAGRLCGTVGGGRLEAKALDVASTMLQHGPSCVLHDWRLKADVGMTCGGRVKLFFERHGVDTWPVAIFGAGHVAQSLARLLVDLPCQVTCIDTRREWLSQLPPQVHCVHSEDPSRHVPALPADAFVLCMTQGHRTDLPILAALLGDERQFPFIGVIGSRAKAAALRKELAAGGVEAPSDAFHCPVGLDIGTNHPGEIAVSIAAQLLQVRDEQRGRREK